AIIHIDSQAGHFAGHPEQGVYGSALIQRRVVDHLTPPTYFARSALNTQGTGNNHRIEKPRVFYQGDFHPRLVSRNDDFLNYKAQAGYRQPLASYDRQGEQTVLVGHHSSSRSLDEDPRSRKLVPALIDYP